MSTSSDAPGPIPHPSEPSTTASERSLHAPRLRRFAWWQSIGSPKHVTAPMVDQSELAFRMMTRKYGADLCYTPMMHAKSFVDSKKYRQKNFETIPEEAPLIAQFCGDDGDMLVAAGKYIEDKVSCIDLNLGCPQNIAKRGHYGSYLLEEPELVLGIVETMVKGLSCPVSVKIRLLTSKGDDGSGVPDVPATKEFVKALDALGVDLICLHPRTKEWKGQFTQACWWESAREIRACVPDVPFIINGGISCYEDVERCFEATACDAVMSSECILEVPTLFAGPEADVPPPSQCELAREYVAFANRYPATAPSRCVKSHMFRMLYAPFQKHIKVRERMGASRSVEEISSLVDELEQLLAAPAIEGEESWPIRGYYWRHQKPLLGESDLIRKKRIEMPEGMTEVPILGAKKKDKRTRGQRKADRKRALVREAGDDAVEPIAKSPKRDEAQCT